MTVALALLGAGCAGGTSNSASSDISNGKSLFSQKCAGCHTLEAANAKGTVGPNLDAAFGPDKNQGFKNSTAFEIVRTQIQYPAHGEGMPANLVRGTDVDDVANFVATCAGAAHAQGCSNAPASGAQSTNGKTIFSTNCASCHTLKNAGATGTVGPNLDQLKPPYATVKHQVTNGGSAMPAFKGQLTDKQIDAVAKYVSSVAGK